MSDRKTVYDAVITAMEASTGILYVTRVAETWTLWGTDKMPGLFLNDETEEHTPLSYPRATADDMEAVIGFTADGAVCELTGSTDVDASRAQLIEDVISTVMADATLAAATADIWVRGVETDTYTGENYGTCTVRFDVRYFYNHASP